MICMVWYNDDETRCFGCGEKLSPETTNRGPASITGTSPDDFEPPYTGLPEDTIVNFCTECNPR